MHLKFPPFLLLVVILVPTGGCRWMMDIPEGPPPFCQPDGVLQERELCDGEELGGATCSDFGFSGGLLACLPDCTFDTSGCGGVCGDGEVTPYFEECEGEDLQGSTCLSLGYYDGPLFCSDHCQFDTSWCSGICGDGVVQNLHEQCDTQNLGGFTCRDVSMFFGELACSANCELDFSGCSATRLWGTSGLEIGGAVTVDSAGNVYVTGPTSGALDGQTSAGNFDIFLTRFDYLGRRIWTRQWGTPGNDIGAGVRTDVHDNVYVLGAVTGALDGQNRPGGEDVFLTRISGEGEKIWTRQWGTPGNDQGAGIGLDSEGYIYATGYVAGSLHEQHHEGGDDAFLVKFDGDGNIMWTRQWGTPGNDAGYALAVDSDDNIYVAGRTPGSMDGQPHTGNFDLFLTRFNSDGIWIWTRQWGTPDEDRALGIATDTEGNIYVTGFTEGSLDGNPARGSRDGILTKFTRFGVISWSRQWGTTGDDRGFGVAVDGAQNACVAGHTEGSLHGQPHAGSDDIFLVCHDIAGSLIHTSLWGTAASDKAMALAMDRDGNMFLTGYTESTLNGQPSNGLYEIFLLYVPALP